MSSKSIEEQVEDLKKRQAQTSEQLEELRKQINQLEQPQFTSATHEKIYDTCLQIGLTNFRMARAPSDYYEWTLEKRRDFLGAASIHQLCKTIIMENTKCTTDNCDDELNSRFYAVIIQYTSRLQTQNLFKFVRGLLPGGGGSRNNYHFRSAKPADVARLTESEFNGVCPIGNKVKIPIILSARLLHVPTGFMFVGGGEPELKLGFDVKEFIEKTKCLVADIAEDGMSTDESEE